MTSLKEKVDYIIQDGLGKFVKYTNTEEFTELSLDTRNFLKEFGLYSYKYDFPPLFTNGRLEKINEKYIKVGQEDLGNAFCIDIDTGRPIEPSFKRFIYALAKFVISLFVLAGAKKLA